MRVEDILLTDGEISEVEKRIGDLGWHLVDSYKAVAIQQLRKALVVLDDGRIINHTGDGNCVICKLKREAGIK